MVTTALGYTPVTNARTLTINGTTYDLSADRSWTISGTIGGLTSGYIPKATSASTLGNSLIYDNGTIVGIGTTSPSLGKLQVEGDGIVINTEGSAAAKYLYFRYSNGGDLRSDSFLTFSTGGSPTEKMRITSGGNLLVGTTTDSGYKLDVNGTSRFSSNFYVSGGTNVNTGNGIHMYYESSYSQIQLNSATGSLIDFSTSGTDYLARILYTNATNLLEFKNNVGTTNFALANSGAATFSSSVTAIKTTIGDNGFGSQWALMYHADSTGASNPFIGIDNSSGSVFYNVKTNGSHVWRVNNSTQMTLTSAGNLGLGTSSPSYKLDIQNSSDFDIRLRDNSLGGTLGIVFETANDFSGTSQSYIKGIGSGNSGRSQLIFGTTTNVGDVVASEKMRLDSSGNLGLGVTPSSWSAGLKALQIGSQTALVNNSQYTYLSTNWDGNGDKYLVTGYSTIYRQQSGEHAWFTAPSGTAGNAISFTQAMTLGANGDLLVGTTTSSYSSLGRGLIVANGSTNVLYGLSVGGVSKGYLYHEGTNAYLENSVSGGFFNIVQTGAGSIRFNTNGSEALRIASSTNILIGTTTDSGDKLYVNGTLSVAKFNATASSGGYITIQKQATDQLYIGSSTAISGVGTNADIWATSGNGLSFYTNGSTSNFFRLSTTGAATFSSSVTAGDILTITSNLSTSYALNLLGRNTTGNASTINFFNNAGNARYGFIYADSSTYEIGSITGTNIPLTFSTNQSERMRITSTGYVATNANTALQNPPYLQGMSFGWNKSNGQGEAMINWTNAGGGTSPDITFNYWNNSALSERMRITSGGLVGIGTSSPTRSFQITRTSTAFINAEGSIVAIGSSDTELRLFGNNNETMTLKSGNVGIGTTSPADKLVVEGLDNYITSKSTSNVAGFKMINTLGTSLMAQVSNALVFDHLGSERMRITSGGNVLIGTTTDSGYKLDVNGTGRFSGALTVNGGYIRNANTSNTGGLFMGNGSIYMAYDGTNINFVGAAATFSSSVTATGYFESSSVAYKNILATNPTTALNVDVIKYTRKNTDTDDVRYGYSAEQINSLMPELTNKEATAVKYLDVHTLLIAELQREIKELKSKLNK
jgi:hypothetical protein